MRGLDRRCVPVLVPYRACREFTPLGSRCRQYLVIWLPGPNHGESFGLVVVLFSIALQGSGTGWRWGIVARNWSSIFLISNHRDLSNPIRGHGSRDYALLKKAPSGTAAAQLQA